MISVCPSLTFYLKLDLYFLFGGGGGGGLSFSQRDDGSSGLQDVFERIEEVVLTAQGLQEVTVVMKELSDVASSNRRTTLVMTNSQAQQLQAAFSCNVCKGLHPNSS